MNMQKYNNLRKQYPVFRYKSYNIEKDDTSVFISFDFEIDGLCSFQPSTRIDISNLKLVNNCNSPLSRKIIFSLGMVEAVSYLKAVCCPTMTVECGNLDEAGKNWWKKLYFGGLGEFFYINGIDADFDSFLTIECSGEDIDTQNETVKIENRSIVPVGGGKDSAVTAELVKKTDSDILFFTVNSQKARTDTVLSAGFSEDSIIKTFRKISPELLELNAKGFLNGHTPFSAIVAFLSLYCAYLTGSENIILSNEASANEGNIEGKNINHQYSKSFEFESDFTSYVEANVLSGIKYFSILRPFNELQIAKEFCRHEAYLDKFRSCNAGSKNNIWCCNCPKCLFVYSILSAFLSQERLIEIFGENLLDKKDLEKDFDGLVGLSPVKPFECVGTISEIKYALALACKKNENKPFLLKKFSENFNTDEIIEEQLLSEFNTTHNIPDKFIKSIKEMYSYVSSKTD